MDLKRAALAVALIALSSCGDKDAKDDKAKQAVKEAITRDFQYYEGAKQKLGETEKQEQQRREQEKQLQ
jgi:hypothetical protein